MKFTKDMSPLDVVEACPGREPVFRTCDEKIGKCLLCHCRFDSLETIARDHEVDPTVLLDQLEQVSEPVSHGESAEPVPIVS